MTRRRKLAWTLGPIGVLLAAAAVVVVTVQPWRPAAAAEDPDEGPVTEVVERTTLTSDLTLNGSLSYGDSVALPGRGGIITRLPKAGDIVYGGQALYEVDGRPVIAVPGARPFWRDLADGMTNGPDVHQLEQFLAAIGYGANLTVDERFTSATTTAVKAWQRSLGLEQTGVVGLGDIVAITADSVRIEAVTGVLGEQAGASPLSYTSTSLRVVAKLTDAQAREILPATAVTITLPDGTEVPGTITEIDPGGEPVGSEGETTPATASVEFADPAVAAGIGLRAVKVTLATSEVPDALVVPVTALVATLDGGYAVDVVRGGKTVRVAVEIGLIADSRAQVVGGELDEGDAVVVAQ